MIERLPRKKWSETCTVGIIYIHTRPHALPQTRPLTPLPSTFQVARQTFQLLTLVNHVLC